MEKEVEKIKAAKNKRFTTAELVWEEEYILHYIEAVRSKNSIDKLAYGKSIAIKEITTLYSRSKAQVETKEAREKLQQIENELDKQIKETGENIEII